MLVLSWLLVTQAPDPAQVRWSAPPGCPDREALLAAVARRRGSPLAPGEVEVDARVAGDASRGYTLHLTLSAGGRGESRQVHDRSCAALADAAALRIVAAVDAPPPLVPPPPAAPVAVPEDRGDPPASPAPAVPEDRSGAAPAGPAEGPDPTVEPPTPVRPASVPEDRQDAPSVPAPTGPGGLLRLHGGLELGAVPPPTGALGLALGLLWPRLRLELHGVVLAPRTRRLDPDRQVNVGLYAGAVHACGRLGRAALEVPVCGGVELGAMRGVASGSGVPEARANTSWWLAGVLGSGLAWHAGRRVSVWAALQLVLAPVRPDFQQQDEDQAERLFRPSAASGRLLVGVELRIRDRW